MRSAQHNPLFSFEVLVIVAAGVLAVVCFLGVRSTTHCCRLRFLFLLLLVFLAADVAAAAAAASVAGFCFLCFRSGCCDC